jgi:hypothetical protein
VNSNPIKWLAIIGGLALLLIIIGVGALHPRWADFAGLQSTNLVVTFLGFTNTVDGIHQALFYFTNCTPRSLNFQIASLEYRTVGDWKSVPKTRHKSLVGVMSPGITSRWAVDVDSTNTAWRVRVSCAEKATGFQALRDRGREIVDEIKTGNTSDYFTGRMYDVVSSDARK